MTHKTNLRTSNEYQSQSQKDIGTLPMHNIDPAQGSSTSNNSPAINTAQTPTQREMGNSFNPQHEWYANQGIQIIQYNKLNEAPFLVLMESTVQNRNLGRYDPIAVGKLIGSIIQGKRRICSSGRNQIKIWCEERSDANTLFASEVLVNKGYRAYLPDSMIYKKGFIRAQLEHSVTEIIENMDQEHRELIVAARRRFNRRDNQYSDIIDITFNSSHIPRYIFTWSVRIFVTPSIPIPKRCNTCQHFGHVSLQCRASAPNCEFCAGKHSSNSCNNLLPSSKCYNCAEAHKASSRDCLVYKFEFETMKYRYIENLSKRDARIKLYNLGWVNPRRRSITNTTSSVEDNGSEDNQNISTPSFKNPQQGRGDPLEDELNEETNCSSDDTETMSINELGILFQIDPPRDNNDKNEVIQPDQKDSKKSN